LGGDLIRFLPVLAVAGLLGLGVAIVILRPRSLTSARSRAAWVQIASAGLALSLAFPVVVLLFEQTWYFHVRGLTEVGAAAFEEPPLSEPAVRAIRLELRPGDTWATVTKLGRCADVDAYAFFWLAFLLVRNIPDCVHPDVELYWKTPPPPDATIVTHGPQYWVVRT
jgi:hypothetical protein